MANLVKTAVVVITILIDTVYAAGKLNVFIYYLYNIFTNHFPPETKTYLLAIATSIEPGQPERLGSLLLADQL